MAKHILIQHQRQVITARDEEDFQRINIRRKHLFDDAMRAFSRPSFNVSKMIKVKRVALMMGVLVESSTRSL